ncbi:sigma-54 interaction domain-containing protein [Bacillus piscicola]|uniref:sigma-54 interaction domain-containing protein n=1 Tax=Bacillus piscicola TaxID=1632684 RepID=UPI001F0918D0|nr:sigma 54-interacting transcriptional regulator [Bacillus piscicola]
MLNGYFITEVSCLTSPVKMDNLLLEGLRTNAKWYVIKDKGEIAGCIENKVLIQTVQEYGVAQLADISVFDLPMKECFVITEDDLTERREMNGEEKLTVVLTKQGDVAGIIENNTHLEEIIRKGDMPLDELTSNWSSLDHSIFITDDKGNVTYATDRDDQLYINQNVYDLEKRREFYPSISARALKSGKRERGWQYVPSGEAFDIESIPIKDKDGSVTQVVSVTHAVSELGKLSEEINDYRKLLEHYQQEMIKMNKSIYVEEELVFSSKVMEDLFERISSIASVDTTAIVLGETGVGKEVVARQVYLQSGRRDQPFIPVNCGAIPGHLLESELFGYEDGAFSGARKGGKIGIFESAHKGTVFLDEVGELPLQLQVKLLRVLQEKKVMRVGGTTERNIDVRIIAATNQDLEKRVKEGKFRADLYYRINVIPIHIPPLRERKEDIYTLIYHFLNHYNTKYKKQATMTEEEMQRYLHYSWPGNVRELSNAVERFVVTGQTHIQPAAESSSRHGSHEHDLFIPESLTDYLHETERKVLKAAAKKYKTTRSIAKALGVNQSTISRKLQKYQLPLQVDADMQQGSMHDAKVHS